jgi:hypothetical protein
MRSILLAVLLALWGVAAHAQVPTLVDFATVSMSAPGMPRTVTDTVCVTDGRDLTCDRGVYVTPAGQVGIGTATPAEFKLSVAEATSITVAKFGATNAIYVMRSYPSIGFGTYWEGGSYRYGDTSKFGGHIFMDSVTGILGFNVNTTSGTVGAVVSGNRILSLTSQTRAGFMTVSPQTLVDVSGTLRLANGGEACDANRTGAIRYTGGDFSFCRNGSSWETLAAVASASDRIVSGTANVTAYTADSSLRFTTSNTLGMILTSDSRVGIGTAAPAYRLHVVNSASSSGILMRDDDSAGYISLREGTSTSGTFAPTIQFTPIGANRFSLIDNVMALADDTGDVPAFQMRTRTSGGNVTRPVLAVQNNLTELMRLTATGALGLGVVTPSNTLHIYGPSTSGIVIGRAGAPGNQGVIDYSNSTLTIGTKANDGVVFQSNGYSRLGIDRSGFITTRGDVGVNIYPIQPSASLHVSGTMLIADGGEACDANRTGAVRYTGGDFSFCRNGSAWETLTSLTGGGASADRITSGTSAVVVNSATGIVSISQLGAVASYVHPSLGYVGPGVSATGTVSASKVATNEVLLSKAGGPCSTAADIGRMFRSPTTGRLQVCADRN